MTINPTKFYKPRRLSNLTRMETMFIEEHSDWSYFDKPLFDFVAEKSFKPMTRRIGSGGQDEDHQITYNFSNGIRNNKFATLAGLLSGKGSTEEYGAKGWSFRMLYEFLCETFNGGVPFIDTYFQRVFKSRGVYAEFQEIWGDIQDDLNQEIFMEPQREDGKFKKLTDFNLWRDPIIKARCAMMAQQIRDDIELCLSTGKLVLRGREGATISKKSQEIRRRLIGMAHYSRLFYASGQLIQNLNIFVEIKDINQDQNQEVAA